MEMFFSVDKNTQVIKIPYVPKDIDIGSPLNNGSFETSSGKTLTLIGREGNKTLTIDSFFPSNPSKYKWLPTNILPASEYLNFFKKNREKVLRIVATGSSDININMLCTITNFIYSERHNKDIKYTLEVEEYIDPRGGI